MTNSKNLKGIIGFSLLCSVAVFDYYYGNKSVREDMDNFQDSKTYDIFNYPETDTISDDSLKVWEKQALQSAQDTMREYSGGEQ